MFYRLSGSLPISPERDFDGVLVDLGDLYEKWKETFLHYRSFVRVITPYKEPVIQAVGGVLMLTWTGCWTNSRVACDLDATSLFWRRCNVSGFPIYLYIKRDVAHKLKWANLWFYYKLSFLIPSTIYCYTVWHPYLASYKLTEWITYVLEPVSQCWCHIFTCTLSTFSSRYLVSTLYAYVRDQMAAGYISVQYKLPGA